MDHADLTESAQVQVRHILKKHSGSRRPASWRCPNITQSKNESIQQITGYLQQLQDTLSREGYPAMERLFQEIAARESDCGSHERGGDLGMFGRGQMQRLFEEASFELAPQQLSGLVDTDSGIHLTSPVFYLFKHSIPRRVMNRYGNLISSLHFLKPKLVCIAGKLHAYHIKQLFQALGRCRQ